jgi:hypothetical protein
MGSLLHNTNLERVHNAREWEVPEGGGDCRHEAAYPEMHGFQGGRNIETRGRQ